MYTSSPGTDNKALQELRDELKDLNKSLQQSIKTNEVFTMILIIVAFFQLIVGIFQYSATVLGPQYGWVSLSIEVVIFVIILLLSLRYIRISRG